MTWAEGKYGRGEKNKSAFFEEYDPETYAFEEPYGETPDEGEYIYLADGDLNEIMDEEEIQAALASYREVRQGLKEQRLGRGYYPGSGKGYDKTPGKSKGKGKNKTHIKQLKLRSRCRRCQQIGHWEREYTAPKPESANRNFFIQAPNTSESYWLRSFVQSRRSSEVHTSFERFTKPNNGAFASSEDAYKERSHNSHFCSITTRPHEGIVDTATEGGLIGMGPLQILQDELSRHGLRIKWTPKVSSAKGVGGDAKVEGVALIPIGLDGINGILETTIVQGDVPLLLPIRLLRALGAVIDLPNMIMSLEKHSLKLSLREMPSGYVATSIVSFAPGPFDVPLEAGEAHEFLMPNCYVAAMPAQPELN